MAKIPTEAERRRTILSAKRCGVSYFEMPMAELADDEEAALELFWKISLQHQKPIGVDDVIVLKCAGREFYFRVETADRDHHLPVIFTPCKSPTTP